MGAAFERIIIVMLENSTRTNVLANPYMNALRKKGVYLSNSYGVTHSSQPNYIVSTGGDVFGIVNDDPAYVMVTFAAQPNASPLVTSIVDLLEAQGYCWKAYAEDLPDGFVQECVKQYNAIPDTATDPTMAYVPPPDPDSSTLFARKHVPFLSYPGILSVPSRAANIVGGEQFIKDLGSGDLPDYSWYTPNLVNDGHTLKPGQEKTDPNDKNRHTNINNIENFLKNFLGDDPVSKFPAGTLIVITFDEAYPYQDPYEIYTLLIGDMLPAGTTRTEPYNHYSLLRTVEKNFGLGSLYRNDAAANPYWFVK